MKKINMGLDNPDLYSECEIKEVAGRLTLVTSPEQAMNIIGRNARAWVNSVHSTERDAVTLTGAMSVWAYLVVFHAVVHNFAKVYYDDGRGNILLLAQH